MTHLSKNLAKNYITAKPMMLNVSNCKKVSNSKIPQMSTEIIIRMILLTAPPSFHHCSPGARFSITLWIFTKVCKSNFSENPLQNVSLKKLIYFNVYSK